MSHDPTFKELIEAGSPLGDRKVEIKLSVRELAALENVVVTAAYMGVVAHCYEGAAEAGDADAWSIGFRKAQARLGIALARATGADTPEHDALVAMLAALDAEEAAWREEQS